MEDEVFKEILNGIKDAISDLRSDQQEIKQDIKDIKDTQIKQQITQVEQHLTLVEHTKRSDANEKHTSLLEEKLDFELAPIKRDIWKAKGALALLGLLLTIIGTFALFHHS